jgi:hypothetical protein
MHAVWRPLGRQAAFERGAEQHVDDDVDDGGNNSSCRGLLLHTHVRTFFCGA